MRSANLSPVKTVAAVLCPVLLWLTTAVVAETVKSIEVLIIAQQSDAQMSLRLLHRRAHPVAGAAGRRGVQTSS